MIASPELNPPVVLLPRGFLGEARGCGRGRGDLPVSFALVLPYIGLSCEVGTGLWDQLPGLGSFAILLLDY